MQRNWDPKYYSKTILTFSNQLVLSVAQSYFLDSKRYLVIRKYDKIQCFKFIGSPMSHVQVNVHFLSLRDL